MIKFIIELHHFYLPNLERSLEWLKFVVDIFCCMIDMLYVTTHNQRQINAIFHFYMQYYAIEIMDDHLTNSKLMVILVSFFVVLMLRHVLVFKF